jgi:ubiquinone/menaquinone biosynthesis C-methylase UbiE
MTLPTSDAPDVETSSDDYARRFSGRAGAFMLARQQHLLDALIADKQTVSILDVGGGHAQLSGPLAAAGHDVTVLGSKPICANRLRGDPRNSGVRFVAGDLDAFPFEDDSFDTVVAIRLMAHVDDWTSLLAEMCRVARRTVLIDYPVLTSSNVLSLMSFGLKKRIEGDTRRYRSFWGSEITRELDRHGWRVVRRGRQFLLPMALHRAASGAGALHWVEGIAAVAGVTAMLGNPAMLRADLA